MTKHKIIIDYIKSLDQGTKISVRKIAQDLNVSEGTAYRAIKDAENLGFVSTSSRVGTIRIEAPQKVAIEQLTYKEVSNITDGTILAGHSGLNKQLNNFVIGAMTVDEMEKYISPGDILIVGNREDAQLKALEKDCAVLISGGFGCGVRVKELSNSRGLPIISSSYDTFSIATMINKAVSEKMIKKDIMLVKDIMIQEPCYMSVLDTVEDWRNLVRKTSHSRFPVINDEKKVVGVVTSKDVANSKDEETIGSIMTPDPVTVNPNIPAAYASQLMIWEGFELIPVEEDDVLKGVLSRQDVIKILQYTRNQPQIGETIDNIILSNFTVERTQKGMKFFGNIPDMMRNNYGGISGGSISILIILAASEAVRKHKGMEILIDSASMYFIKPAQFSKMLVIEATIVDSGRKHCKIAIEASSNGDIIARAFISIKVHKSSGGV